MQEAEALGCSRRGEDWEIGVDSELREAEVLGCSRRGNIGNGT